MQTLLCQRNQHWANNKIGKSWLTIGKQGCALTCLSMVSAQFGHFMDPAQIAKNVGWFTPTGLIIWKALKIPQVNFTWRWYIENDNQILMAINDPSKAMILNVWGGKHWVQAIKQVKTKNGFDYLCADPWTGKMCYAKQTYGNIVGSAYFIKTAA